MPAAGYIELILQAMEGDPLVIETLEFLQPCPIPRTPVRLQTELRPVPNSPDRFTFTITTQPYDNDAESELHSRGKVRLVGPDHAPNVPGNVSEIDTLRYEPLAYAGDDELYERFEAVLGETFHYGQNFRNMRRLRRDVATDHLLFDVDMSEELWRDGQEEGYVSFPALLDGGLQSFLYDLMLGADLFAIPRRAENVLFLRAPTAPQLTCRVTYPGNIRYEVDDKGQYSVPTGEWVSGSISCYDGATGDIFLHIEKYISFISNPRRADLPFSKHRVIWQPKSVPSGAMIAERLPEGDIEPSALLSALAQTGDGEVRACHALEFAGDREPEETVLHRCVDHLSTTGTECEYWLVGSNDGSARAHYEAFHRHDATLRFDCIDPPARQAPDIDSGLLRRSAADVLFLHCDEAAPRPRRLAVLAGGGRCGRPGARLPRGWSLAGPRSRLDGTPRRSEHDITGGTAFPGQRASLVNATRSALGAWRTA